MPRTGFRACSWSTKVLYAAISGRGSRVRITVSSMSLTSPKSSSAATTNTRATVGSVPDASRVTSHQPGGRPGFGSRASTFPDRSVRTVCATPPTVTVTSTSGTSAVKKFRQPRRYCCASRHCSPAGPLRGGERRQDHAGQDAHEVRPGVPDVGHTRCCQPRARSSAVDPAVPPVLEGARPVRSASRPTGQERRPGPPGPARAGRCPRAARTRGRHRGRSGPSPGRRRPSAARRAAHPARSARRARPAGPACAAAR